MEIFMLIRTARFFVLESKWSDVIFHNDFHNENTQDELQYFAIFDTDLMDLLDLLNIKFPYNFISKQWSNHMFTNVHDLCFIARILNGSLNSIYIWVFNINLNLIWEVSWIQIEWKVDVYSRRY